jgi:RHS repeat-associated protein
VLALVDDKKIQHSTDGTTVDYYNADVVTANDYYPGGMQLPGRKYSIANTNYRYGFNGKENDNEVKGDGNQQDYGMRIYDPRLGRFLSVDPLFKEYPFYTPYQFAGNTPIRAFDLDGLEITFSDVWHNRASIVDWINDPGTWTQGAQNVNETVNPIYQAYGHGYEIVTGNDFNTGQYKGRGKATADAGVDVMMWATGEKVLGVFRYENAVEKQVLKNASAMGQAEKSAVQSEAQKATNAELKSTVATSTEGSPKQVRINYQNSVASEGIV